MQMFARNVLGIVRDNTGKHMMRTKRKVVFNRLKSGQVTYNKYLSYGRETMRARSTT